MNNNQTPPDKPAGDGQGGPGGEPGGAPGDSSASVSHSGATTLSESTTINQPSYSSTTGGENALLVTGGEITLENPTVAKSGDESSENSDFYGTNAAVLATGGTLTISGGSVTTTAAHANGIFAYGDGNIVVKNTTIKTSSNNSGGIMVTGGGKLSASNLTVETAGNSSAPIRSDRGGGELNVSGGTYTSNGMGSPAIYSTANIAVENTTLISNSSEGVVIEGSNSVRLTGTTLTDTNNTLNGNSETYKNIFIYQSMSGDAEEGTGSFTATNSIITTNQGDTFFVTNTTADIALSGNKFINNDASSAFLRTQAGKWGTSGKNGGHVKLTMTGQVVEGDIILDNISTLNLVMNGQSYYMGAINSANTAQSVTINLDATSQLVLAGDSYVSELVNVDSTNQNIYSNGHKLYVGGQEVVVNDGEAPAVPEVAVQAQTETTTETTEPAQTENQKTDLLPFIIGGAALLVIIAAIVAFVLHNKKKKGPKTPGTPQTPDIIMPNTPNNPLAPQPPAPTSV